MQSDQAMDQDVSFADRLQSHTAALHLEAEKTGIVRDLLRGQADKPGYALYLRNLLPAYEQLETGLALRHDAPGVAHIFRPELSRSEAIRADLEALCGATWASALPLLEPADQYAARIAAAADGQGSRLIAHAYVRYLGDLNGGQILKRLLMRSMDLAPSAATFYDFTKIADPALFKTDYRDSFNRAIAEISDPGAVMEEAADAFRINIALSKDVLAHRTEKCAAVFG